MLSTVDNDNLSVLNLDELLSMLEHEIILWATEHTLT